LQRNLSGENGLLQNITHGNFLDKNAKTCPKAIRYVPKLIAGVKQSKILPKIT
jgi:hypothetical protein